ncbi:ParA family protein [Actinokineospora enzanensis]|uniref:ParA family protein n=1 Tax=Actinokineospora enzanensis TaxID=155975 RepID=UPI000A000A74|nr:ParA family protein [Actinokineospora enzanensis]
MSEALDLERARLLAELPPSAWMTHEVEDPDNAVAVLAKKGGTSKTSFAAAALDACARFGLNALGIDVDPQGNLSIATDSEVQLVPSGKKALGNKEILLPDRDTIVEVLEADSDGVVDEGFQMVPWEYNAEADFTRGGPLIKGKLGKLGILPAHEALEDIARNWKLGDLERLNRSLNAPSVPGGLIPRRRWDLVIIDLLPGGSDIGRMGLKAARRCLIVTRAEPFGMNAISKTVKFAWDVRDNWNHPNLNVAGLVLSAYKPRNKIVQTQLKDLRVAQEGNVQEVQVDLWKPRIPDRTIFPTAQDYRAPISAFLSERGQRKAATEVCQVAEAIVLKLLHQMAHPDATELQERWERAWPEISPWATGDLPEVEL